MKYINIDEYIAISHKVVEDNADMEVLIELASISVNNATLTRIEKIGFKNLTSNQQELIKKAVVEQIKYIQEDEESLSKIGSYSLDDISINLKESEEVYEQLSLTKNAYIYLKQTGLMFRGC